MNFDNEGQLKLDYKIAIKLCKIINIMLNIFSLKEGPVALLHPPIGGGMT